MHVHRRVELGSGDDVEVAARSVVFTAVLCRAVVRIDEIPSTMSLGDVGSARMRTHMVVAPSAIAVSGSSDPVPLRRRPGPGVPRC